MKSGISKFVFSAIFLPLLVHATSLPEPGLVMYGAVRNAANGNARLVSGTITWTITPAGGSPINLTTALTNIGNQYSYLLRVPFESIVGNATLSPNALQLNTARLVRISAAIRASARSRWSRSVSTWRASARLCAPVPFTPPLVTA